MITPAQVRYSQTAAKKIMKKDNILKFVKEELLYLDAYRKLYEKVNKPAVLAIISSPDEFKKRFENIQNIKFKLKIIETIKKNKAFSKYHDDFSDDYLLLYNTVYQHGLFNSKEGD